LRVAPAFPEPLQIPRRPRAGVDEISRRLDIVTLFFYGNPAAKSWQNGEKKMFQKRIHAARLRLDEYRRKGESFYQARVQQGRAVKEKAERTYRRYEKQIPIVAFIAGFLYDSLTLTRIDLALDNVILFAYTILSGILLVIWALAEQQRWQPPFVVKHLDWIVFGINFLLGSLLSSYVVFYFKSAGVAKSYLFVGLLIALLLANEFYSHRLQTLRRQIAVYFFCSFSFFTFFLPTYTHILNVFMFVFSGLIALALTAGIIFAIYGAEVFQNTDMLKRLGWPPLAIFAAMVLLYFLNWIPPVPLALKDSGIYRSVKRSEDRYEVRYTKPQWWQVLKKDDSTFEYTAGDTVFCFAAVFAPTALQERIVHHWQMKNAEGDWVTTDRIGYAIRGGRDGGWRGFTRKLNAAPGDWRVEVKTEKGRLLGRVPIEIRAAQEPPKEFNTEYR
jgi:hypothetical protein